MLKPILQEMYDFISEYLTEPNYRRIPRSTDNEKIRLLALIFNDEMAYHLHHQRIIDINSMTPDKVIEVLRLCIPIFKNDKRRFIIALNCHRKRVATIKSRRYVNWKEQCKLALSSFQYCAFPGCNTSTDLHVDHCMSKYEHPELEFDIMNSQMLCSKHNLEKGSSDADYRTPEMIEAQKTFIRNKLNGKSIIF
jgi:hypothetical protein